MNNFDRDVTKASWWSFKRLLVIFLVIMVLGIFFKIILFPLFVADKAIESAEGIVERTLDADNVIHVYEEFHDRYEDIKATGRKIKNAEDQFTTFKAGLPGDSDDWKYNDRQEYQNQNTLIIGLKNHLEDLIGKYNSDAKKYNKKIFKDKGLPQSIKTEDAIAGTLG